MNPDYDIEVIRSSLYSGEIDDTVNFIKKSLIKYERVYKIEKNENFKKHINVLNGMMSVLEGKSTTVQLKNIMKENYIYGEEDADKFLDSLIYIFDFCIDRYNIRWPSFDGKRCDDL
ncbi:hypothetical protein ACNF42_03580 [Cuniculiplasma sp. SKW3]|uniref:hypothetical protein n=1 Tax=Cuniculiplasma sp. SKW3 TaxID=3400170 RepID=UPI003FD3EAD4